MDSAEDTITQKIKRNARFDLWMAVILGLLWLWVACDTSGRPSSLPRWLETIMRMFIAVMATSMVWAAVSNWRRLNK